MINFFSSYKKNLKFFVFGILFTTACVQAQQTNTKPTTELKTSDLIEIVRSENTVVHLSEAGKNLFTALNNSDKSTYSPTLKRVLRRVAQGQKDISLSDFLTIVDELRLITQTTK